MSARIVLMTVSVLSIGLMAGLYFGWQVSVVPGLKRVDHRTYISTMQSINGAIVNPLFVVPFVITPVLLAAAAVAAYRSGRTRQSFLMAAASVSYLMGMGTTIGRNVPLNDALDAVRLDGSQTQATATARSDYEGPWKSAWHLVRTIASTVSFALAITAALVAEAE